MIFPDINVWLAMVSSAHVHHLQARRWFESLRAEEELIFCRLTQLGLLRLLTQSAVMGKSTLTQRQAWRVYDSLIGDGYARLMPEHRALEEAFREWQFLTQPRRTIGLTLTLRRSPRPPN